jgi:hypothetical protein
MLLIEASGSVHESWFDSHPPLAERIRRIYGRPMTALRGRADDFAPTRPQALP